MKYKLLIVDLDDTLTPNLGMPPEEFKPSSYLKETIKKISNDKIKLSLCTGRDKKTVLEVVEKLSLTTPQIIEGGSRIVDHLGKTLWVKFIERNSSLILINLLKKTKLEFSIVADEIEFFNEIPEIDPGKVTAVLWYNIGQQQFDDLKQKLSSHQVTMQVNRDRFGNTVYITHREGTKAHGVKKLMEILGVKKEEAIGIGDGHNDKELLLNCGFKVAMGNAVEEIKSIADYIAPSAADDGVAKAINKIFYKIKYG